MTPRERKIEENLGLVHACARRFVGRGTEYDDLFQAGCIGLVKAVDGFDESRGLQFSTYAVPVILGEIRRLFRDGGAVKVGRTMKDLAQKAARERLHLLQESGREPTVHELAERLGTEPERVAEALGAVQPPLSLTRSTDEGEETVDVPVPPPEERITDRIALQQVIGELAPRDRALIVLRYLNRKTQQSTADCLGMTQVQVSRRERVILEEMRRKLTG